eukprot:15476629-Alexandrium_andersonii.AAC.1
MPTEGFAALGRPAPPAAPFPLARRPCRGVLSGMLLVRGLLVPWTSWAVRQTGAASRRSIGGWRGE